MSKNLRPLSDSGVKQGVAYLKKPSGSLRNTGIRFKEMACPTTLDKKSRVIFAGPIPDHTDDIKSTKDIPSWKRMCYCILKNDHTCRFMGFGLTRQEQKRIDLIKRKYGGIMDDN